MWLYYSILGYFVLFLRYLMIFFNFRTRDMKHLTKISMVGAFWLCKWEEASSIPYGIEATPFWGSHIDGSNNSEETFPGVHRRDMFCTQIRVDIFEFSWRCITDDTADRDAPEFFDMYQKSWSPNPWFQYVRCINSWCFFWYFCLKKTSIEPQIYHHQCENSQGKFGDQTPCSFNKPQAAAKLHPDHPGWCIKSKVLIVTSQKKVRCECMVDFSTYFFFIGLSFVCVSFRCLFKWFSRFL